MSGINNPYAQGGWVNPQNPYSINDPRGSGAPPPSIYGALPYSQSQGPPRFVEFQFTGLNPDVLNCIVMGPNARHCYTIATSPASSNSPSVTGIRNDRGVVVAKIEWYQRPSVEAPEFLPKQYAGQWMPLSNDMSHRTLLVNGRPYALTTNDGSLQLYNTAYNPPELLAKISRTHTAVVLNVTQEGVHRGILEVSVLIATLLYSGRRID